VEDVNAIEKISTYQFFILVFIYVVGSSVLFIPTVLAAAAEQDAWIVALIGGFLGIGVSYLYVKLAETLQDKNMIQIYDLVFGVIIGKFFTLLFCFYCLILASLILRGIGDFLVTQIMPETPMEVIIGLFVFIIISAYKYGIEVFSRSLEIFFPWILFLLFFGVVLILPDINYLQILPIFDNGIKPILKGTFSYLGFPYLECVLLLMIVPYWSNFQKAQKSWMLGTMAGSIVLFIPVILSIMVLGAEVTSNQTYVTYVLAKKMGIPKVIERMEVIIAIFWIFTIFYKLLLCFFCLNKSFGKVFSLSDDRILAFPLGIVLICTSIIIGDDIVGLNHFSSYIWPFFSIQTGLILPVIILLMVKVKKLKDSKNQ
jgi:spore germination protein KB